MNKQDLKVQKENTIKKKNITESIKQQRKEKNKDMYEQQGKGQELNNRMIYSGDTKNLSALLSYNPSFAIKDLL